MGLSLCFHLAHGLLFYFVDKISLVVPKKQLLQRTHTLFLYSFIKQLGTKFKSIYGKAILQSVATNSVDSF